MWSHFIEKIHVPRWLRESDKQLRTVALLFIFLVCVNLLLYVFFIVPASARLKAGEEQAAEFRRRHAQAVLFKKQEPLFAGLLAGIPAQKDIPLLVKEFVQLARKLNLSVASINSDLPRNESGGLGMLSFSFPVEGRYPDIKRFIYEVETSDRLIGMQGLKLESNQGRVKLQMKLITYVRGN